MKPILLALLLASCGFAFAASVPGYYGSSGFAVAADYDTAEFMLFNPGPDAVPVVKILPSPGAKLNYTQIMFEHPQVAGAAQYIIEVARDTGDTPFKHLLVSRKDSSTASLIGCFQFGKKYIWRFSGLQNGKVLGWQGPYRFETLYNNCINKNSIRVRVLKNDSLENAGGLLMLDMSRCVDRNGNFVWFLPNNDDHTDLKVFTQPMIAQDLRLTPAGTVTLLHNGQGEEMDLSGKLLWHSNIIDVANNNKIVGNAMGFHHCFKKLVNGNYMLLGQALWSIPGLPADKNTMCYETINEFSAAGNLVWSWSSKDYVDTAELVKMAVEQPDVFLKNRLPGGHLNAFETDETGRFIYAGFRNVSRVIKIDKETGKVVCTWGKNATFNGAKNGQGFFLKQHGTSLLADGSLAVFSNNVQPPGFSVTDATASSVVVFSQPVAGENSKIVWKYDCAFDSADNLSHSGGNVDELKNKNLLVCMGEVNRVFEVTRDKKIVWNALIESYDAEDSTWRKFALYRAHYTSSLYPCYFTVQSNKRMVSDGKVTYGIKIFNDGTEDDSYTISITSATGNKQFSTSIVKSKRCAEFEVKPDSGYVHVTVISKTNVGLKRIVTIQ